MLKPAMGEGEGAVGVDMVGYMQAEVFYMLGCGQPAQAGRSDTQARDDYKQAMRRKAQARGTSTQAAGDHT